MLKSLSVSFLIIFILSGCFNTQAPKCSDDAVQETLKDVYLKVLTNLQNSQNPFLAGFTQGLPKSIDTLSSIRAVSYDEAVKIRSCKADVSFDNNQTATLEYTVQLNEENNDEFYVELDTDFLEGLMQESIMQGIFNK